MRQLVLTPRVFSVLHRICLVALFLYLLSSMHVPNPQPARAAPTFPQEALTLVYAWHTFLGGLGDDGANGVSIDSQGNIYLVGESTDSWLGPGDTPPLHAHSGSDYDIVVVKLDPDGAYQWHTFYGGSDYDEGISIALNTNGAIFVSGRSRSNWLGDSAVQPLHAYTGDNDIAVLKLNSAGQYQWHTFYGSTASDDVGMDIAVDSQGDVLIAGYSNASWLGDGSAPAIHPYSGTNDITLLKLSGNGAYIWHTFYGSAQDDRARAFALDDQDNLFVTGFSNGSWLGDGNNAPIHAHTDDDDIMVMKLSATGVYQWHTFYGSPSPEYGEAIAVDALGDLIVSGESFASWNADGAAPPLHAHSLDFDFTLLKLSPGGAYLWHTFYGSNVDEYNYGVTVTAGGEILLVGESYNDWLGDGGAAPLHAYTGSSDFTILQVGADGHYDWHTFYGSSEYDYGIDLTVDDVGNVIIVGLCPLTWQGDNGAPPLNPHVAGDDITVLKFAGRRYYLPLLQR